jgi:hypothetical protein
MALPTGGYTFTPQTANLGASPLSALKPLDVGVSVSFTPMPKYEVPSARPELVSVGMAQGLQGFSEPIISAYKAMDDEAKKKEDDALKYMRDVNLAKIKAEKTPMELAYEQARYNDLLKRTDERGGNKVPVKTRAAGSLSPNVIRSSDRVDLPENPKRKIDFNEESLVPPPKDEELPPYKPVGALFDISYQPRVVMKPEPFITEEQIAAVRNPPLANMQAATGGVMVPPAPIPEATPTPTPEVRAAIPVTTQPTSFKATPDQLARIEENRLKMIQEATVAAEASQPFQEEAQPKMSVDEEVGNLTELPYESKKDAMIAAARIQELMPNYNRPKITRETDKELGRSLYYVEQPEINDKYVAPGTAPKLSADQAKLVLAMQGDIEKTPTYSKALIFRDSKNTIFTSLAQENGFADIAAINSFQRLIDPGVSVREGDVALINSAIAFLSKYNPEFIKDRFAKGDKLPKQDRENMRQLTNGLVRIALENANKESIPRIRKVASDAGLDPDYIIKPFDIPLDKTQLTNDINVLSERMKSIPKSQANDPAAKELINKYKSLKTQLQQAK